MTLLVKYLVVICVRINVSRSLRLLVAFWIVATTCTGKTSQLAWSWTATSTTLCMNTKRSSENLPFLPLQLCCSRSVVMVMVVMVIFLLMLDWSRVRNLGRLTLVRPQQLQEQCYPFLLACAVFCLWSDTGMAASVGFFFTCAQMLMHVTAHGGCTL